MKLTEQQVNEIEQLSWDQKPRTLWTEFDIIKHQADTADVIPPTLEEQERKNKLLSQLRNLK